MKVVVLAVLAFALLVPQSFAAGQTFQDLGEDQETVRAIRTFADRGIVIGTEEGAFSPNAAITREQASIIVQRVFQLQVPETFATFADVPTNHAAAGAVYAVSGNGLLDGKDGKFLPKSALTREEAATLFANAFRLRDNGIRVEFADEAEIDPAHISGAIRLKQHFIVEGESFLPKQPVTRAEFVFMLYRAMNMDVHDEGTLPLEYFFSNPAQVGFQPSPDGKYLAFMQPWENRMNIYVQEPGKEPKRVTNATDRNIAGFAWANDEQLIYMMDQGGDENYHLYSVSVDGTGNQDLTPYDNTRAVVIDALEELENEVLIGLNKRDPRIFDVYRLNLDTGETELVAENPGNISGWMTDRDGKLRIALVSDGNTNTILYRETEEDEFAELITTDYQDTFAPLAFAFDDGELFVASNLDRDKLAIQRYDIASKQVVETIFEHPEADVSNMIVDFEKRELIAALYYTDQLHYHFFDEELEATYLQLQDKLPGMEINLMSMDDDGRVMLVAHSDKSPGTYYYYDTKSQELEKLAVVAPWIDSALMADMRPIRYEARDGLTIHGYLTLPNGSEPRDLPVVVIPHGGPWARDAWGFNPEVQFLANRGYAVLQVNFRGSTGYGKAFVDAGNKQWGRAMQDDITDGVNWLIEQGVADADRIAIYGASYGGYAALAGLAFTPDVYAAGVSYVGPSNLFTLLASLPPYWESEREKMYARIGHPEENKELLTAISPLFSADRIEAPLFVAQGANDPRVNIAESDQIVSALKARGIDVPYMVKDNEGHGFANVENQIDFYLALEKFLHKHLQ